MFGTNKRRGGLLGSLFGGSQQPRYRQRGGLLNNPLARAAMLAGAAWLGRKFLERNNTNNFNNNPNNQYPPSGANSWRNSTSGNWPTPNNNFDNPQGKSW